MSTSGADRPVTIYDVARACGVSPSTVSRTFSRPGRISEETASRVRKAAEELGYHAVARRPRERSSTTERLIAVVAGDMTNPFSTELMRGADAAAGRVGYTAIACDVHGSAEDERTTLDRVIPTVQGIVLAASRLPDQTIRMIAARRPTVVVNRPMTDVPGVLADTGHGVRLALEHLADLGHDDVLYVRGQQESWADSMRWRAMLQNGRRLGMRVRAVGPNEPTRRGGSAAAPTVVTSSSTAVVAYNDLVAMGLVVGLTRLGVTVPRDISVVGFDDIFGSDFFSPPLTTVAAPLRELGGSAVRTLVDELEVGPTRPVRQSLLPSRLLVRGSTARVRARRGLGTGSSR